MKAGNKLLLVEPNLKFRANSENELERRSVNEAFAKSVLFGFEIKQKKGDHYVIDFTPFLLRDAHGVAQRLKSSGQGSYKLDVGKSALAMNRTKSFPENSEFEAMLTFEGEPTGNYIRSVSPNPNLVTVVQHHSFIKLPDLQYTPRVFDPRSGSFSISYMDYATPVTEPITKQFITRHRLKKKHPELEKSEAVEPIVYYLDNGTPEPIRSALVEGALWWNQAFEAIGYINAFQVKILPDDADPLDVRYNVIQWVHRSTRGWSYGASVRDPRTGEILKGHVSLGSLRIRQDFMIAQALAEKPFALRDDNHQEQLDLALARIRQLSAHEVGHTLGFAHNFAASTVNNSSVMDYPHPKIGLDNNRITFQNAYDTGIGSWDKVTVAYAYQDFSNKKDEKEALIQLLDDAFSKGHRFISDSDARAQGGAHAYAHLWDNGKNPVDELERVLNVREKAISTFSKDNIRTSEPFSVLEDMFVPLYFFHRYQTEAAVKWIGGVDYNYAIKGKDPLVHSVLDPEMQRQALKTVVKTLEVNTLLIPEDKLAMFPPRAYGYGRTRESFKSNNGVTFDPINAAQTAADFTLSLVLHPERANRLVQQQSIDSKQLGLSEVIKTLVKVIFEKQKGYAGEVQKSIQTAFFKNMLTLAKDKRTSPSARAEVYVVLVNLADDLAARTQGSLFHCMYPRR